MSAAHNRLALLVCCLAVVACSGDTTLPTSTSALTQLSGTNKRLTRPIVSNAIKYRDTGAKPAQGRSGLAALEVRALMASSGVTTIEATTGTFDGGSAVGVIEKAQLKLLDSHYPTINEKPVTPSWTHEISSLVSGESVQIQANVSGIDATRMDVVTATTSVRRRPDLQIGAAQSASAGLVGVPVVITASVRELNGEVGARTSCVLVVDGLAMDQASGIWVDAGDVVTCQFSHAFVTAGTHTFNVQAIGVSPGDWDYANNVGASGTIEIRPAGNPIATGRSAITLEKVTGTSTVTREGAYPIAHVQHTNVDATNIVMDGMMNSPTSGIFTRLEARGTSGGVEVYSETLELALSYGDETSLYKCSEYYSELNALALACTTHIPWLGTYETMFSYWRASGTLIYYGQHSYCNTIGCDVYSYTIDDSPSWQPALPFDPTKEAGLDVTFVEADGQRWLTSSRFMFEDLSDLANMTTSRCYQHSDGLGQACSTFTSSGAIYEGIGSW